ncbi:MAG: hypothetical protein HKN09_05655 [Saprospiraceae bacterium]|nr:hypothetical protein [Saprospiraceae bacterium]
MSAVQKFALKLFLFNSTALVILFYVLELSETTNFSVHISVASGLAAAVFLTISFVSLHLKSLRAIGITEFDDNVLSTRPTMDINCTLSQEEIVTRLKQTEHINISSLKWDGRNLRIGIRPSKGPFGTKVYLYFERYKSNTLPASSESVMPFGILDDGKNMQNLILIKTLLSDTHR